MSVARWPSYVSNDYAEVLTYLTELGILPSRLSRSAEADVRLIHGLTYSLMHWRFLVRTNEDHKRVFLQELASDAVQILRQSVSGYRKTVLLLVRCVIEDAIRHVYYWDHRVEFERMHRDPKWFVGSDELIDYLKTHPLYAPVRGRYDAPALLKDAYRRLSEDIHGRTVRHLEMRRTLSDVRYKEEAVRELGDRLRRVVEPVTFVLLRFHEPRVDRCPVEWRRTLIRTVPRSVRRLWRSGGGV